jgi:hypothetical protein
LIPGPSTPSRRKGGTTLRLGHPHRQEGQTGHPLPRERRTPACLRETPMESRSSEVPWNPFTGRGEPVKDQPSSQSRPGKNLRTLVRGTDPLLGHARASRRQVPQPCLERSAFFMVNLDRRLLAWAHCKGDTRTEALSLCSRGGELARESVSGATRHFRM